jgi:hypothetical protein
LEELLLWPLLNIFLLGLGLSLLQQLRWLKRARGTVAGLPLSKCRSAAQGYVRLFGTQRYIDGKPLLAPLTGKPCTWWSYTIERYVPWRLDRNASEWEVIKQATSASPLVLDDGTGQVTIDLTGAGLLFGAGDRWHGETASPVWPPPPLPAGNKYRYTESRMDEGHTIHVAGQLTTHSNIPSATAIKQAALGMLTRWKQNLPTLRERFDRNHDGVIDPDEWETARQAAFAAAESELSHEQDLAVDGRSVIAKPADGKPFVISPLPDMDFDQLPNPSQPTLLWLVVFLIGALWCIRALAS